jgi:hypothetical protein
MKLTLIRDWRDTRCCLGKLFASPYGFDTIERPWIPSPLAPCGQKGVSCVPPGVYELVPHSSEAHGHVWALVNPTLWVYHWDEDVPLSQRGAARTLVLLHIANYAEELRGCIAPGLARFEYTPGRWMVTSSRRAIEQMQAWADSPTQIEIS